MSYQGHGGGTQRAALFTIATLNGGDLQGTVDDWKNLSTRARQARELIQQRLDNLVQEGGWQGSGAETFRTAVIDELLTPLKKYEDSTAALAQALSPVADQAKSANGTAASTVIPWDQQTKWDIKQKTLNSSDFEVPATNPQPGQPTVDAQASADKFTAAQANADWDVLDGDGGIRKTISNATWNTIKPLNKPLSPVFHGAVSGSVNQFDVWLEALGMNPGQHQSSAGACDQVEVKLGSFITSPSIATDPAYTGPTNEHGTGDGGTTPAGAPINAAYNPSGYTPPSAPAGGLPGGTGSNPQFPGTGGLPGGGLPGTVGGLPGGTTTLESGIKRSDYPGLDGSGPSYPGGNYTGSDSNLDYVPGKLGDGQGNFWTSGTQLAGVEAPQFEPTGTRAAFTCAPAAGYTGMPAGSFGGLGSGAGAGIGSGMGAAGAGLGSLGQGIGGGMMTGVGVGSLAGGGGLGGAGAAGGLTGNSSFQMGPTGRGVAAPGSVGGVQPAGAGAGGTGAGTGQGNPMGMAPLNAKRDKKKDSDSEGDETWLEEEEDVWGATNVQADGLPG